MSTNQRVGEKKWSANIRDVRSGIEIDCPNDAAIAGGPVQHYLYAISKDRLDNKSQIPLLNMQLFNIICLGENSRKYCENPECDTKKSKPG